MIGRRVDGGHQHHHGAGPDHRQQRLIQASFPVSAARCGAVLPLIQKLDTNLIIQAGAAPASRSAVHRSPWLWVMPRSPDPGRGSGHWSGNSGNNNNISRPAHWPLWPLELSIVVFTIFEEGAFAFHTLLRHYYKWEFKHDESTWGKLVLADNHWQLLFKCESARCLLQGEGTSGSLLWTLPRKLPRNFVNSFTQHSLEQSGAGRDVLKLQLPILNSEFCTLSWEKYF